jgi:hypothetical protein
MEVCSTSNLRQFQAIKLRFRHNWKGFWKKYRLLIGLLLFAAVLDGVSTVYFMSLAGVHPEVHPHIRLASHLCGPVWGPLLGKTAQIALGLIVIIYVRKYATLLLLSASALYLLAAGFNLISTGVLDQFLINLLG